MQIFSETQNPTARLFLSKSLFSREKKNLIITDNHRDFVLWKNFSSQLLQTETQNISNIGELFSLKNEKKGIFYCHIDIFRTE